MQQKPKVSRVLLRLCIYKSDHARPGWLWVALECTYEKLIRMIKIGKAVSRFVAPIASFNYAGHLHGVLLD